MNGSEKYTKRDLAIHVYSLIEELVNHDGSIDKEHFVDWVSDDSVPSEVEWREDGVRPSVADIERTIDMFKDYIVNRI